MPDKPSIAMTPGKLPAQRVNEVVDLPSMPEGFDPVICNGYDADGVVPKRIPNDMLYLGSLEWAWSPMHDRISAYHLHRGRRHWILYVQDLEPEDPAYAWMSGGYTLRRGVEEKQAAVHLVIAMLRNESTKADLDRFHWINQDGYLSVPEWIAIEREVWGP